MTVLLTRPKAESLEVAEELRALGIETAIWPLTQIVQAGAPVTIPSGTEGLIVTSAHGLAAFAEAHSDRDLPVLAVGDRTARLARSTGFHAESAGGDVEALAALARRSRLRRLFHPRGRDSAADLVQMLAPYDIEVSEQVLYAAEPTGSPPPPVARALREGKIRTVTFWSARNASLFNTLWAGKPFGQLAGTVAVAISPRTAAALDGCGFGTILISDRPDRQAMIRAIRIASAVRRQQS